MADTTDVLASLPTRLGDFRVLRLLGRGGMEAVYEGVQEALGRRVAIKVLQPDLAGDRDYIERFRREAKAAGSFVHRHLIQVYKAGEEAGVLYFAIEFIDGVPVSVLLSHGRACLPVPRCRSSSPCRRLFAPDSNTASFIVTSSRRTFSSRERAFPSSPIWDWPSAS